MMIPDTQSTDRRKRPWLAFASVLLALTSFSSAQNADLSDLVPSVGTFDPAFDSPTTAYTEESACLKVLITL